MKRDSTVATCPIGSREHRRYIEVAQADLGASLPFCAAHMAALPRALVKKIDDIAMAGIFEVAYHAPAARLFSEASHYLAALLVRGICRVCGCIDEQGCEGGCSWVDESRTLCSRCVLPPLGPTKGRRR